MRVSPSPSVQFGSSKLLRAATLAAGLAAAALPLASKAHAQQAQPTPSQSDTFMMMVPQAATKPMIGMFSDSCVTPEGKKGKFTGPLSEEQLLAKLSPPEGKPSKPLPDVFKPEAARIYLCEAPEGGKVAVAPHGLFGKIFIATPNLGGDTVVVAKENGEIVEEKAADSGAAPAPQAEAAPPASPEPPAAAPVEPNPQEEAATAPPLVIFPPGAQIVAEPLDEEKVNFLAAGCAADGRQFSGPVRATIPGTEMSWDGYTCTDEGGTEVNKFILLNTDPAKKWFPWTKGQKDTLG